MPRSAQHMVELLGDDAAVYWVSALINRGARVATYSPEAPLCCCPKLPKRNCCSLQIAAIPNQAQKAKVELNNIPGCHMAMISVPDCLSCHRNGVLCGTSGGADPPLTPSVTALTP